MAKLNAPLLSMSASGSIGGILTFGSNKGRNFVRQLVIPANPRTAAQQGVRSMMKWAGQEWAQLSDADQATWETRATQLNSAPFNGFMSKGMDNWSNAAAPQRQDPAETVITPPVAPSGITSTVIERRAKIDWVDPTAADSFGVVLYLSTVTGFTPGRDNAIRVTDLGVLTTTTDTLLPDTYFYRMTSFDIAGVITAASTQASFVIV